MVDLFRCLGLWMDGGPMFILFLSSCFIKHCLSGRKNGAVFTHIVPNLQQDQMACGQN